MNSLREITIYSFHYKLGEVITPDRIYQPLMAGNVLQVENHLIPGDNTGDHISEKNPYYSELTGIYWAWKNTTQDITGSCHYRRFFTAQSEPFFYRLKRLLYCPAGLYKKRYGLIYTNKVDVFLHRILNADEINELFLHYDAILPQARKLKYTVETHYHRYHDQNDLVLLKSIMAEKYPEYVEAFDKVMSGKRLYANNMFVLPKPIYEEFMGWWFDLLFEFERRIQLANYDGYQKRILGFIAERLLTIWFCHQNLRIKELQVVYFKKFKYQ